MEEYEWFMAIREGNKKMREAFITMNLPLVWSIAKRFLHREKDLAELVQIGSVGLIKAVDGFDIQRGVTFSTYAVPFITGEIKRHFRDHGLMHVSRELKKRGWELQKIINRHYEQEGRSPTIETLCQETGYEKEEVVIAMEANLQIGSIQEELGTEEGRAYTLETQICKGEGCVGKLADGCERDEMEQVLNRICVQELLQGLTEEERKLILLRYFQCKTQSQVASILGMSQVQVSRKEKKILLRMLEEYEMHKK